MLHIQVGGISQVFTKIGMLSSSLENNKDFFEEEAAPIIADEVENVFDRAPWQSLAESTIEQKGHDTILRDSDRYYDAFTTPGGPGNLTEANGNTLRYGVDEADFLQDPDVDVFYPRFHEEGDGVPRRSVLDNINESVLTTKLEAAYETKLSREIQRLDL